jgi:glycosyltransferase involved in cell wall biosynthesis
VKLSVLIDTYNHERLIETAINSVLEQDFPAPEREVIVVNDGSTDGTAAKKEIQPFSLSCRPPAEIAPIASARPFC